jgi:hypothetical protein
LEGNKRLNNGLRSKGIGTASVRLVAIASGMKILLSAFLIGWSLVLSSSALACEKHLDGHQSSSDSSSEATRR